MRFPAVVEEQGVVDELLAPNEDYFLDALADLEGRVQFALKGRYEQDVVLREVIEDDDQIRALHERVRDLPEDASYYDRVRLGELVVAALEQRRDVDAAELYERLENVTANVAPTRAGQSGGRHRCGFPGRPECGRRIRGGSGGPGSGQRRADSAAAARAVGSLRFC